MKKIIQFRPLEWKDLKYAKIIKPFEDLGLVEDFSKNDNVSDLCELICDVSTDYQKNHYRFDHLLHHSKKDESPSTLFLAVKEKSDRLPSLWAYTEDKNGRRRNIHAIKDHRMLQSMAYALEKESKGE